MKIFILTFTLMLTGCASNHHLVFFTNTTIGLEVGSEPANGTPAKFILGYKRQEGVIDPLIPDYIMSKDKNAGITEPTNGGTNIVLTPNGTAIPKGSLTRAHSVLAKMNFGATGGGTDASAAQFFATGKASELLAASDGITGALSGDPQNNVSQKLNINAKINNTISAHLDGIYQLLTLANTDRSREIKVNIDQIDKGLFKDEFIEYYWVDGAKTILYSGKWDVKTGVHSFDNTYTYLQGLNSSFKIVKEAILKKGITDDNGVALTDASRKTMLDAIEQYPRKYEKGSNIISSNRDVLEMINYVYNDVLLESE
ncbi:hypothetical protein [Colwellia sp. Arc7-D]|uniref:hypothetical protein n=1 Tax=Colwellia sp. Arc7-D TaxID=2161872 RepID=UPI000D3CDF34|nr:hypothetical protein [Colwellia sp. Arc7-D]AWB57190.1 hypothetical protein DBO93_06285 [Colwellia sp. Arc7-D]